MVTIALVVLAVLGAWAGAAVMLALVAGAAIRVREERDVRCSLAGLAPVTGAGRPSRRVRSRSRR